MTQLRGETATIDASGPVTLNLGHDAHLTVGNAVEIVGKVNQDLSVKVLKATDLGRDRKFISCLVGEKGGLERVNGG